MGLWSRSKITADLEVDVGAEVQLPAEAKRVQHISVNISFINHSWCRKRRRDSSGPTNYNVEHRGLSWHSHLLSRKCRLRGLEREKGG